jgi:hypothetical protein
VNTKQSSVCMGHMHSMMNAAQLAGH